MKTKNKKENLILVFKKIHDALSVENSTALIDRVRMSNGTIKGVDELTYEDLMCVGKGVVEAVKRECGIGDRQVTLIVLGMLGGLGEDVRVFQNEVRLVWKGAALWLARELIEEGKKKVRV